MRYEFVHIDDVEFLLDLEDKEKAKKKLKFRVVSVIDIVKWMEEELTQNDE